MVKVYHTTTQSNNHSKKLCYPSSRAFCYQQITKLASNLYYRELARDLSKELTAHQFSELDLQAQKDFPFFCGHVTRTTPEPKYQPEHMQPWNDVILTGQSSNCLLQIAGQNTSIRASRGAAKSTYLAFLVAWLIGIHTMNKLRLPILYISYTVDVASPKSGAIKAVLESPEYQMIFPAVKPGKKWGDEHWEIDYKWAGINVVGDDPYTLWCAGLKGAITSKRCLTGDTMVLTELGEMQISQLENHIGIKVLAFDEQQQRVVSRRVKAFDQRPSNELVEIRTSSGCRLRCTTDHPIYVVKQGYRDAGDLLPGQSVIITSKNQEEAQLSKLRSGNAQKQHRSCMPCLLSKDSGNHATNKMQDLSNNISACSINSKSKAGYGDNGVLLQSQVPWNSQYQTSVLPEMQCQDRRSSFTNQCSILPGLSNSDQKRCKSAKECNLSFLSKYFLPTAQTASVLFKGLLQPSTFTTDDWGKQQSLQGWNQLQQRVYGCSSDCFRSGQPSMHSVQGDRNNRAEREVGHSLKLSDSSPQPQSHRQPNREPNNNVSWMPCQASQNWQVDTVESVVRISGTEQVYDIEVEDTHNFFANGILVHNCSLAILDDLIKSPDDIASADIRAQMDRNWTRSIMPTMLDGGRAIHIGNLQRADDIQATRFTPANKWQVISQKAIIQDEEGNEKSYWDFYSLKFLQDIRDQDPVGFSFQYQNEIVRINEIAINPEWITECDPHPIEDYEALVIGLDLSSKLKEKNDFTVFVLGGRKVNDYHLLDSRRGRWAGNIEKLDVMLEMLVDWGLLEWTPHPPDKIAEFERLGINTQSGNSLYGRTKGLIQSVGIVVYLYAEDVSYQGSLAGDFQSYIVNELQLYDLIYRPSPARSDKLMRLRSVSGLYENGVVKFNRWRSLAVVKTELTNFGSTQFDDACDSSVHCLLGLRGLTPLEAG